MLKDGKASNIHFCCQSLINNKKTHSNDSCRSKISMNKEKMLLKNYSSNCGQRFGNRV